MSVVAIKKCNNYEFENVYKAMKEAIELSGGIEFVKGKKILLKPNLLAPVSPEKAVTTHPVFVKAAIRLVKENGGIVQVGDSPGIGTQDIIYGVTGIKKVCEEEGAEIADFRRKVHLKIKEGKVIKGFDIAKCFEEVDYVFSLPKLKTHGMTYYTGAIKNLFGMVTGLEKPKFHYRCPEPEKFADMLIDLNLLLKPAYAIMDGIVAMEGNGPRNGNPRKVNIIAASRDLTALDATVTRIVGIDPNEILPIKMAALREFGEIEEDKIEVVGEKITDIKIKNFQGIEKKSKILDILPVPEFIHNIVKNSIVPKPYFIHKRCIKCKICIDVCPSKPKSLELVNEKIKINRKSCIRCFCCQEMCPVGAIEHKVITFS